MAFCLKIKFVCQRSECASTLDPQASLLPVLSIITLNHLKSGCRDVKKHGDVYGDSKLQRPRPAEKKTSSAQCDVTSTSNLIYLDNFTLAQKYTTFLLSPEGEQDQPNSRSFLDSRIWFSFYLRLSYAGQ